TRLASFLLLPIYTRYLNPADYGTMAILDLTAAVFGTLIGTGIVSAVNRYHFEAHNEVEQDAIWWTGLTFLGLIATALVTPAWLLRTPLAHLTLGPDYDQDRKSTRLNSSHQIISYAVFCLKKKIKQHNHQ